MTNPAEQPDNGPHIEKLKTLQQKEARIAHYHEMDLGDLKGVAGDFYSIAHAYEDDRLHKGLTSDAEKDAWADYDLANDIYENRVRALQHLKQKGEYTRMKLEQLGGVVDHLYSIAHDYEEKRAFKGTPSRTENYAWEDHEVAHEVLETRQKNLSNGR